MAIKGTVYKSTGSWYKVKDDAGKFWDCRIKGKFRIKGIKSTNPIAVGDVVHFDPEEKDENQGIIHQIEDRKNAILRKSINLSKQTHIIACNVDLCLLFLSLKQPKSTLGFIDRFLVSAEAFDVPVYLVFNKVDLLEEEEIDELAYYLELYEDVGYQSFAISLEDQEGLEPLENVIKGKNIMLAGNSGTGKSSFANYLSAELDIRVGDTSTVHHKGKHTTTFAEMHDLPNYNARLIDTPGVKSFGLSQIEKDELPLYFPDLKKYLSDCKFYNCKHLNEPGCAVKAAVENEEIAPSRYNSYLNILNDYDE